MNTYRSALERIERRVEMPEPAFDRMLRRGERRDRTRRVASGCVALLIGGLGIRIAFAALLVEGTVRPASGAVPGGPDPAGWLGTALPGLALAAAAAILIAALVGMTRPLVRSRAKGSKEGADMDSETKGTVRHSAVELPEGGFDGKPPAKANRWLVVAVAILTLAVLGLGAALIVTSNEEATPAPVSAADPAVTTALDGMAAALSSGDVDATVAFYAENGTLILADDRTFEGTTEIEGWMSTAVDMGVQMERVSDVFGNGTFGAALYRYTTLAGSGYMIRAITLDSSGKIFGERELESWRGA